MDLYTRSFWTVCVCFGVQPKFKILNCIRFCLREFCRKSNLLLPKLDQLKAHSRSKGRTSMTVIIMLIY